jgi:hypothetical protein
VLIQGYHFQVIYTVETKCMGKTRSEISRNRGLLNQESVTKMVDRTEVRRFGCLIKVESNRKPRQVWKTRVQGTKGRGRPRMEWEEHVRKNS